MDSSCPCSECEIQRISKKVLPPRFFSTVCSVMPSCGSLTERSHWASSLPVMAMMCGLATTEAEYLPGVMNISIRTPTQKIIITTVSTNLESTTCPPRLISYWTWRSIQKFLTWHTLKEQHKCSPHLPINKLAKMVRTLATSWIFS